MADKTYGDKALLHRQMEVSIDRAALREAIAALSRPGGSQEWCIACGAGKGTDPRDKADWVQSLAPMMQGKSLKEFVEGLKDIGNQAWCIACGAGKDASPLDQLANPADLSDDVIDHVAARLLNSIKVG